MTHRLSTPDRDVGVFSSRNTWRRSSASSPAAAATVIRPRSRFRITSNRGELRLAHLPHRHDRPQAAVPGAGEVTHLSGRGVTLSSGDGALVVVYTIRGFRGRTDKDRVIQGRANGCHLETAWTAGLGGTAAFQHRPGTAKVRPLRKFDFAGRHPLRQYWPRIHSDAFFGLSSNHFSSDCQRQRLDAYATGAGFPSRVSIEVAPQRRARPQRRGRERRLWIPFDECPYRT